MLRIGPNATSDENSAINIIQDTQRVGIQKDPTGEYILDVSGAINCDAIFVGGTQFTGSSGGGGVWTQDASGDISYGDGNVFIGAGLDVSGYLKVPFGSSDVSSATYEGYIRYNDVSNEFQGYDTSENVWSSLGTGSSSSSSSSTTLVSITTDLNAYKYIYTSGTLESYTFLSNGSIMSNIDTAVDIFMVGGGGGGGSGTALTTDATTVGGGGGAGEVYEDTITLTGGVTYTIVIGTGGIANTDGNDTEIIMSGSTVYNATGGTSGNQYGGGSSGSGNSGGVGSTSYHGGGGGGQGGTGGSASSSGGGDGGSGFLQGSLDLNKVIVFRYKRSYVSNTFRYLFVSQHINFIKHQPTLFLIQLFAVRFQLMQYGGDSTHVVFIISTDIDHMQ